MKKIYLTGMLTIYSVLLFAQRFRGYDDDRDAEDIKEFQRYAHLGLSKGEITAIVIGIVLLFIAQNIGDKNPNLNTGLQWVGFLCMLPLLMVILAVAQKVITYGVILACILGGLYFLFGQGK
jgi:hypothetical protein